MELPYREPCYITKQSLGLMLLLCAFILPLLHNNVFEIFILQLRFIVAGVFEIGR